MDGIAAVVCLLGLPFLVIAIVASVIEKRPTYPSNPTCPRCRASLPAAGECPACPGCGLPKARIARVTCPACRYDLIGTLDTPACPECGLADAVYAPVFTAAQSGPRAALAIVALGVSAVAIPFTAYFAEIALHEGVWRTVHSLTNATRFVHPSVLSRWDDFNISHIITAFATSVVIYTLIMTGYDRLTRRAANLRSPIVVLAAVWLGLLLGSCAAAFDTHQLHIRTAMWTTIGPTTGLTVAAVWEFHRRRRRQHAATPRNAAADPACDPDAGRV